MRPGVVRLFGVVGFLLCFGCSSVSMEYRSHGDSRDSTPTVSKKRNGKSPRHASLKIPPGHLPPPGACRVWFPGKPPGRQPRAGDCAQLSRNLPKGAWLLHRPAKEPRYVDVSVYEDKKPGVLLEVRVYEAESGTFVKVRGKASF